MVTCAFNIVNANKSPDQHRSTLAMKHVFIGYVSKLRCRHCPSVGETQLTYCIEWESAYACACRPMTSSKLMSARKKRKEKISIREKHIFCTAACFFSPPLTAGIYYGLSLSSLFFHSGY